MRAWLVGCVVLVLAGCSQRSADQAASSDVGGPGNAVSSASGVAFVYDYRVRLPATRISAVQDVHATACERLGPAACRITGMRYSLDERGTIDAMLAIKLAPPLARAFGREGIVAVEKADGKLVDATITGTDGGGTIAAAEDSGARLINDRARIERELARPGLNAAARAELLRQRGTLDAGLRAPAEAIAEQRRSLAMTPMTFTYDTGGESTLSNARDMFVTTMDATLTALLYLVAVLGPLALIAALALLAWRIVRHRWPRHGDTSAS